MGQLVKYLFLNVSGQDEQVIIYVEGSFNLLYFFTDCKELITRNLVDGQSILLRRKRAMTMLVPFSGKYLKNGLKTKKVSMAEWKWRQGIQEDCQGL